MMREFQKRLSVPFFFVLSMPATAMGFALSVQISALSWILSTKYGFAIHEIGLVWAAGPIAGIFGQVAAGHVSDRIWLWGGRRRPFLIVGGTCAAIMLLSLPSLGTIAGALGAGSILGIAVTVALVLDLAINIGFNPARALISDTTSEGRLRTKGYAWMQTVSGSFGVLAYGIGALFGNELLLYFGGAFVFCCSVIPTFFISEPKKFRESENLSVQESIPWAQMLQAVKPLWGFLLYDVYSIAVRLLGLRIEGFYAEGICGLVTLYLVLQVVEGRKQHSDEAYGFQGALAAHSFCWIGVQAVFVYLYAFVQDAMPILNDGELGEVVAICFLLFNAVAAIVPNLLLERLSRRIGLVATQAICMASMALGYFLVPLWATSPATLYMMFGFLGIGWAAVVSLPFAIISQQIEQSRTGLYIGLFNLSIVLPQLGVSTGLGLLMSRVADKSVLFVVAAASLAVSALLWGFMARRSSKEGAVCSRRAVYDSSFQQ